MTSGVGDWSTPFLLHFQDAAEMKSDSMTYQTFLHAHQRMSGTAFLRTAKIPQESGSCGIFRIQLQHHLYGRNRLPVPRTAVPHQMGKLALEFAPVALDFVAAGR